ncbi:MAG: GNAT family N-acetyltransferase, partial [Opitutales bacterium]
EDAVKVLAEFLEEKEVSLQGATGPVDEVDAFADAWEKASGIPPGRGRSLKIFEFALQNGSVTALEAPGRMRLAEETDRELVRDWAISFAAESPSPMDPSTLVELAEAMRAKGNLFLWEDGEPMSMAGFGRSTPNGLVVNMVYTPGERRRLGYAGALIAGLMVEASQRGAKLCCLFSEYGGERNLYERIGFREVGTFRERAFSS